MIHRITESGDPVIPTRVRKVRTSNHLAKKNFPVGDTSFSLGLSRTRLPQDVIPLPISIL